MWVACELGHLVSPGPGAAQGCTGCCKRPTGWSAPASSWPSGSRRGRLAHRSLLQAAGKGPDSGGLRRAQPEAGCPPGGKRPPDESQCLERPNARPCAGVLIVSIRPSAKRSLLSPSFPRQRLQAQDRVTEAGSEPRVKLQGPENPGRLNGSSGGQRRAAALARLWAGHQRPDGLG